MHPASPAKLVMAAAVSFPLVQIHNTIFAHCACTSRVPRVVDFSLAHLRNAAALAFGGAFLAPHPGSLVPNSRRKRAAIESAASSRSRPSGGGIVVSMAIACVSMHSEEDKQRMRSQAIDKELEEEGKRLRGECKILLLGIPPFSPASLQSRC